MAIAPKVIEELNLQAKEEDAKDRVALEKAKAWHKTAEARNIFNEQKDHEENPKSS